MGGYPVYIHKVRKFENFVKTGSFLDFAVILFLEKI